jgi:F0F1-type ATP synthase epsilon subunit
MQVLTGHITCLIELSAGVISYENPNRELMRFMIGAGVVEVNHDQVNVLCEQARFKTEIDRGHEESLASELRDQIKKYDQDDAEQKRLFADLEKCAAKLSLFE